MRVACEKAGTRARPGTVTGCPNAATDEKNAARTNNRRIVSTPICSVRISRDAWTTRMCVRVFFNHKDRRESQRAPKGRDLSSSWGGKTSHRNWLNVYLRLSKSFMSAIRYRVATQVDIPVLAALPQGEEGGGDSAERMALYLAGKHHPQKALGPRAMWVAEAEGGVVVGYVAGHLTRRYECDGELQWICVVKARRGTGVALALLRLAAQWFVEQGATRVCVNYADEHARRFYGNHGATDLVADWMVWEDIGGVLNI